MLLSARHTFLLEMYLDASIAKKNKPKQRNPSRRE